MKKVVTFPNSKPAPNQHFSYVDTGFDEVFEQNVRMLTRDCNPNAPGERLPQDKLEYAFITVNATTGYACEYGWASGRKDVRIIVDLPYDCVASDVIEERAALIKKLEVKYYDRGFKHGGSNDENRYNGGFEEFAQNYQLHTGRECAQEIAALCERERESKRAGIAEKVAG